MLHAQADPDRARLKGNSFKSMLDLNNFNAAISLQTLIDTEMPIFPSLTFAMITITNLKQLNTIYSVFILINKKMFCN